MTQDPIDIVHPYAERKPVTVGLGGGGVGVDKKSIEVGSGGEIDRNSGADRPQKKRVLQNVLSNCRKKSVGTDTGKKKNVTRERRKRFRGNQCKKKKKKTTTTGGGGKRSRRLLHCRGGKPHA